MKVLSYVATTVYFMRGLWRFFQTVIGIIFRHPIPGTSIIPILPDGRIVLIQRTDNGLWSLPDRDPRIHSICIVVEAEVQGKMKIQDRLEVKEIRAFPPSALPPGKLAHDHTQQLQDYFAGLTTLA